MPSAGWAGPPRSRRSPAWSAARPCSRREALAARARRYANRDWASASARRSAPANAPPLRLVLLGDSSALGVGVDRVADTVGGQLARCSPTGRARAGPALQRGRLRLPLHRPGHPGGPGAARRAARRGRGADRRERRGRPAPARRGRRLPGAPPCAGCATRASRWSSAPAPTWAPSGRSPSRCARWRAGTAGASARAQAGPWSRPAASVVDLARETGAVFRADAGTLCYDGFHPSADGYRVWAHALLPGRDGRGDRRPPGVTN